MSLFSAAAVTSTLSGTVHSLAADLGDICRQHGPPVYSIFTALALYMGDESRVE